MCALHTLFFFFFNDTATTEIYTLSLHDALPICRRAACERSALRRRNRALHPPRRRAGAAQLPNLTEADARRFLRSEEHTSELQSQSNLVCRLLLEKKKIKHEPTLCSLSVSPVIG